eukprot:TRINITY_DN2970_c0_g1_i1.p1 TRINITY_DN2970_c0_g1~~TRINITY_DN2970_c0_g1_i1.p1  ORF type:complete len:2349 (+),score=582.21 TRINITY_DN2970_c0_g1_i1:73-7119(+)
MAAEALGIPAYRSGTVVACGWGPQCGEAGSAFANAAEALAGALRRGHRARQARVLHSAAATRPAVLAALAEAPSLDDDLVVWMLSMPRVYARTPGGADGLKCAPAADGGNDVITASDLEAAERALARRVRERRGAVGYHLLYIWDPTPPTDLLEVHLPIGPVDKDAGDPTRHVGTHCAMTVASPYNLPIRTKPIDLKGRQQRMVHYVDDAPMVGLPSASIGSPTVAMSASTLAGWGSPPPYAFTLAFAAALEDPSSYPSGQPVTLPTLYRRVLGLLAEDPANPDPPDDVADAEGQHYGAFGHVLRPVSTRVERPSVLTLQTASLTVPLTRRRGAVRRKQLDGLVRRTTVVFSPPLQLRLAAACTAARSRRAELASPPVQCPPSPRGAAAELERWWRQHFGELSWVPFHRWWAAAEGELETPEETGAAPVQQLANSRSFSGATPVMAARRHLRSTRRFTLLFAAETAVASVLPPPQTRQAPVAFADAGLYPTTTPKTKQPRKHEKHEKQTRERRGSRRAPASPLQGSLQGPGLRQAGDAVPVLDPQQHQAEGRVYLQQLMQLRAHIRKKGGVGEFVAALLLDDDGGAVSHGSVSRRFPPGSPHQQGVAASAVGAPSPAPSPRHASGAPLSPVGQRHGSHCSELSAESGSASPISTRRLDDSGGGKAPHAPSPVTGPRQRAPPPALPSGGGGGPTTLLLASPTSSAVRRRRPDAAAPAAGGAEQAPSSPVARGMQMLKFLTQVHTDARLREKLSTVVQDQAGTAEDQELEEERARAIPFELRGLRWLSMLNRHATHENPALPPPLPPTILCLGKRYLPLALNPRSNPFETGCGGRPALTDGAQAGLQRLVDHLARCGISMPNQLTELPPAVLLNVTEEFPQAGRELLQWRVLRGQEVCRPIAFETLRFGLVISDSITALQRELEPLLKDKRFINTKRIRDAHWDAPGTDATASKRALLHLRAGGSLVGAGVTLQQGGLSVDSVEMGSHADRCGVCPGMELATVGGKAVRSPADALAAIEAVPLETTVEFVLGTDVSRSSASGALSPHDRHRVLWDVVLHRCGHELPSRRSQGLGRILALLRRARLFDEPERSGCYGWPSVDLRNWVTIGGLNRAPSLGTLECLPLPDFPVAEWCEIRDEMRLSGALSLMSPTKSTQVSSMMTALTGLGLSLPSGGVPTRPSISEQLRDRVPWFPVPQPRDTSGFPAGRSAEIKRLVERRQAEFLERYVEVDRRHIERLLRLIALREPDRFPRVENITEEEKALMREAEAKAKAEEQLLMSWDITPDDVRQSCREYLLARLKETEDIRDVRPLPHSVGAFSYSRGAVTLVAIDAPAATRTPPLSADFSVTVVGGHCHVAMRAGFANPLARRARKERVLYLCLPDPLRRRPQHVRISGDGKVEESCVVPAEVAAQSGPRGRGRFSSAHVEVPLCRAGGADRIEAELEWVEELRWNAPDGAYALALPSVMSIMMHELETDVASVTLRRGLKIALRVAGATGVHSVISPTHPVAPHQLGTHGLGMLHYSPVDGPLWANRPAIFFVRYPAAPCLHRIAVPLPTLAVICERIDLPAVQPVAAGFTPAAERNGFRFRRSSSAPATGLAAGLAQPPGERPRRERLLCYLHVAPPAEAPPPPAPGAPEGRLLIVIDTSAAMGAQPIYYPPLNAVSRVLREQLGDSALAAHCGSLRVVATGSQKGGWAEWAADELGDQSVAAGVKWLKELVPVARPEPCTGMWEALLEEARGSLILLTASPPCEQLEGALQRARHRLLFSCLCIGPHSDPVRYSAMVHANGGHFRESFGLGAELQRDAEALLAAALPPHLLTSVSVAPPPGWRVAWSSKGPVPPSAPSRAPLSVIFELEQDALHGPNAPEPSSIAVRARYPNGALFEEVAPLAHVPKGQLPGRGSLRHMTQPLREAGVGRLLPAAEQGSPTGCCTDNTEWRVVVRPACSSGARGPGGSPRAEAERFRLALLGALRFPSPCLALSSCAAAGGAVRAVLLPMALSGRDREQCTELLRRPGAVPGWVVEACDVPLLPVTSPVSLSALRDELCTQQIPCSPVAELALAQGAMPNQPGALVGVVRASTMLSLAVRRAGRAAAAELPVPQFPPPTTLPAARLRSGFRPAAAPQHCWATADDDIRRMRNGDTACWHEHGWGSANGSLITSLRQPRIARRAATSAAAARRPPDDLPAPVTVRITFSPGPPASGRLLQRVGEGPPPSAEELRHAIAAAARIPPPEVSVDYPIAMNSRCVSVTFAAKRSDAAHAIARALARCPDTLAPFGLPPVTAVSAERRPEQLPPRCATPDPSCHGVGRYAARLEWDAKRLGSLWPVTQQQRAAAALRPPLSMLSIP